MAAAAAENMGELFPLDGKYGIKEFLKTKAFRLGGRRLEKEFQVIEHNQSRSMKGSSGTVMKVRHNDTNKEFAMKRVVLGVSL